MGRRDVMSLVLALATVAGVPPALAQTQDPPAASSAQGPPQTPTQAPSIPPDLERIRDALNRPSTIRIDNGQLKIYVEIIAKWPSFTELVKGYDLRNGPTKRGAVMTHQEFLQMVTPKEMYSTAGIRPTEMLQIALTNWVGKALVMKGIEEIRNARNQREIDEIRARIDRELAALRGGR